MKTLSLAIVLLVTGAIAQAQSTGTEEVFRVDFVYYADGVELRASSAARAAKVECVRVVDEVNPGPFPRNYAINPINSIGLSESLVTNACIAAAQTWNEAGKRELFAEPVIDYTIPRTATSDGTNVVTFSDIFLDGSVLAFVTLWFTGDVEFRITEFDIVVNEKIPFGDAAVDAFVFDLQSVVLHEMGHVLGFDHTPRESECREMVMYPIGMFGSTSGRTPAKAEVKALRTMIKSAFQGNSASGNGR